MCFSISQTQSVSSRRKEMCNHRQVKTQQMNTEWQLGAPTFYIHMQIKAQYGIQ